ncbi:MULTISPECIES: hypothetical protein [unclassified Lysobacter]|uniref:hypothetical protein n=1 Tax=unclassified Lysobacter TaxID=2635362 RepID=UPI001BE68EFA|nr:MULTISPECIES: hypothetical protein [unclassified Lysobacter]MBT2748792.1 hypothetical protein [Lysobacter sp. ISL-42]MBT2754326.1 hypothetical protein [Lysobacter sp. ISL-50]MBT2779892.1 hypothetical protein [Lysobacter sp. ISL-54]MBT2783044.1 hypothetical protein [Lysobacter sp. ISL-52]
MIHPRYAAALLTMAMSSAMAAAPTVAPPKLKPGLWQMSSPQAEAAGAQAS